MNEQEIISKALKALEINAGIVAKSIKHEVPVREAHFLCDAELKLNDHAFFIEVKKNITNTNIGLAINQVKRVAKGKVPLLITNYINPNMAQTLKNNDVNYLDTVGNTYIKTKEFLVLIKGNKAPPQPTEKIGRAFTPTGLKVIYAFLVKPALLNAPYREIADAANVSLGAIGWVLRDLKDQRYIIEGLKNKKRQWNEETKDHLIDKWVEAYPKLKQKYFINRYTTSNHEWWKNANIEQYNGLLAGEIAANKYTNYLKPQDHLVYISKEQLNDFLRDFRLRITNESNAHVTNIDVVEKFWGNAQKTSTRSLTTPLLTYADLIVSGDVRNREVAQMIRDEHL